MKRRKSIYSTPAKRTVKTYTTPAPVQGLNTRDPLAAMDITNAISATNWIASPQGMSVRQGWAKHYENTPGLIAALMVYKGATSASDKLFAADSSKIYDATSPDTTPTADISGLSNGNWEHVNFSSSAGKYLVCCNGQDTPRMYNGSAWSTFSLVASPANPGEITTGTTTLTSWKQVISHQRRLWMVIKDTSRADYLPINSVGGAAASFDFGPVFPRGGFLHSLASWSIDVDTGPKNMLIALSNEGDVAIYSGTNPADAAAWSLEGSWKLARPVGQKCFYRFGGDLLYLSEDGLVPLTKYLKTQRDSDVASVSLVIQPTITSLAKTFRSLPGFEMIVNPGANMLLLNVPQINASDNFQFCMNTITNGWSKFEGIPAQCWADFQGDLYFGYENGVGKAFVGYKDNANADGTGGDAYIATVQQAFHYFEKPAVLKRFVMGRPNFITTVASPAVRLGCNVDFDLRVPTTTATLRPSQGASWNSAQWDQELWAGQGKTYNEWQTLTGVGYCGSITMAVSVSEYMLWTSTDWVLEEGQVIG